MDNLSIKRQDKLLKIAETNNIYQVWARSFEYYREDFIRFANTQPEEIRNFLYGYADSGRMMMQKLVNLACEYMIFPGEE